MSCDSNVSEKLADKTRQLSNCLCARMAYILATYQPAPTGGAHALSAVCTWWTVQGLLIPPSKTQSGAVDAVERCAMIAGEMQVHIVVWCGWMDGGRTTRVVQVPLWPRVKGFALHSTDSIDSAQGTGRFPRALSIVKPVLCSTIGSPPIATCGLTDPSTHLPT